MGYPGICCCRNKGPQFGQGQAEFVTNEGGNGLRRAGRAVGWSGCDSRVPHSQECLCQQGHQHTAHLPRGASRSFPCPQQLRAGVSPEQEELDRVSQGEEEQAASQSTRNREMSPGTRTGAGSAPLKAIFRRAVRSRAHAAAAAALKGFEIFKKSERPIIAVSQLIIIFFLFV